MSRSLTDHEEVDTSTLKDDRVSGGSRRAWIIVTSSLTLVTVWATLGSMTFYEHVLAGRLPWLGDSQAWSSIYRFMSAALLLGVGPLLIVRYVLREPLSNFGVQLGHRLLTIRSFLLATPLMLLLAYGGSFDPAMRDYYPLNHGAGTTTSLFVHVLTYVLFYVAWEFHFRGFMQLGLTESLGLTNAILAQVAITTLLHIGTPTPELLGSVAGGLFWGVLVYRTKSIVSGTLQHIMVGITLDVLLIYELT